MGLKGLPNVLDIRCVGLDRRDRPRADTRQSDACAAIACSSIRSTRPGIMLRISGDTIELTPPLIVSENEIGEIMDKVAASIKAAA